MTASGFDPQLLKSIVEVFAGLIAMSKDIEGPVNDVMEDRHPLESARIDVLGKEHDSPPPPWRETQTKAARAEIMDDSASQVMLHRIIASPAETTALHPPLKATAGNPPIEQ